MLIWYSSFAAATWSCGISKLREVQKRFSVVKSSSTEYLEAAVQIKKCKTSLNKNCVIEKYKPYKIKKYEN